MSEAVSEAAGYGRQFAGIQDRIYPHGPVAAQIAARLAQWHLGAGPALELGVGTGRIALPLAERVGEVVGVDAAPELLELLRQSLDNEPRPVHPVLGDLRDYTDARQYGLVYCVCATLSMVLDPAGQKRGVAQAARALAPGAALVIETHNPAGVEALHDGQTRTSFFVPYPEPGTGLLSYSTLDLSQRLWQLSHIWFEGGGSYVANEMSRLTTPEEIDGYAERAGLALEARYGDWLGSPFQGTEMMQVSVYRGR